MAEDWVKRMLNESTLPVFAGVGGAVTAALATENIRPMLAVAMVIAGALTGAFVVPWGAEVAGIRTVNGVSALAFLAGMFALPATRFGQQHAPQLFDALLRRFGVVNLSDDGEHHG